MGPVLEMSHFRPLAVLLMAAVLTGGCGNDPKPGALPVKAILQAQLDRLKSAGAPPPPAAAAIQPDAATLAEGRKVLEAGGQPVMSVTDRSLGLATFMVPLGSNAGVITWANPEYQTIALRDGVILATRGFGADLMSASAPTARQLRGGSGSYLRVHYVLDGADQTIRQEFDCGLSVSNNETITILGLSYVTTLVEERCVGSAGALTNRYWFDAAGGIRQSQQARAPGVENMQLQAIID
jgi:hypothetical protein